MRAFRKRSPPGDHRRREPVSRLNWPPSSPVSHFNWPPCTVFPPAGDAALGAAAGPVRVARRRVVLS